MSSPLVSIRRATKTLLAFFSVFVFILTLSSAFAQSTQPGRTGGSDGGSVTCNGDPNTYGCLDSGFCEQYPEHIRCVDHYWCESYPDDPRCITPEFCEAQPTHPKCVPDTPYDCRDFTGKPISCDKDGDMGNDPVVCRDAFGKPVECPDDRPVECVLSTQPDAPQCLNPEFCKQYPNDIRCKNPSACNSPTEPGCITPEFCRLNPSHPECTPDEPTDCKSFTGAPISCEPNDNPNDDPVVCVDDFGRPVECPDDRPEICREKPELTECLNPEFCKLYPDSIRCTDKTFCQENPDSAECITPEFCRLNPSHPECTPDEPTDCKSFTGAPISCEPNDNPNDDPVVCVDDFGRPVECPDDRPEICREKPELTECLNPEFCKLYPDSIRCGKDKGICETKPETEGCITPEFCRLNPSHPECTPGKPTDCKTYTAAPISCDKDGAVDCYDDFGQKVECPHDGGGANACVLRPEAPWCMTEEEFCRKYPENIRCIDSQKSCSDGSPLDALRRCPDPKDNQRPDDDKTCFENIPVLGMVEVPCGNPDDNICAHPDHKFDPDCCAKWDTSGQRCLDPKNEDDDDNVCVKEIEGRRVMVSCDNTTDDGGSSCREVIDGQVYVVPCEDEKKDYEACVAKYDVRMCDADPSNDFSDLPTDPAQREAIQKLGDYCPNHMKIFQGYVNKDGSLAHVGGWNDLITRYDALLVLQRFESCGETPAFTGLFPFIDVPKDHYAYDAVGRSYVQGKTDGYEDAKGQKVFRGNNNVLNAEALKWILLVKTTQAIVDLVPDNGLLNPALFENMKWAVQWWLAAIDWKVVDVQMVGKYYNADPSKFATRGQIALWLANTLGL